MTTYNLGGYDANQAGSLAGTLNSLGSAFTLSPSSNGYTLNTSNNAADGYLSSAGITGSSNGGAALPAAPAADSPMTANGTYTDGSAGGTAQTDTPVGGGGSFSEFMKTYGADAAAIVVGLLIIAGAVWRIV